MKDLTDNHVKIRQFIYAVKDFLTSLHKAGLYIYADDTVLFMSSWTGSVSLLQHYIDNKINNVY